MSGCHSLFSITGPLFAAMANQFYRKTECKGKAQEEPEVSFRHGDNGHQQAKNTGHDGQCIFFGKIFPERREPGGENFFHSAGKGKRMGYSVQCVPDKLTLAFQSGFINVKKLFLLPGFQWLV